MVYLAETGAGIGDMGMGMAVADMRSWSAADFGLMFAAVNLKRRLIRRRAVFPAGYVIVRTACPCGDAGQLWGCISGSFRKACIARSG